VNAWADWPKYGNGERVDVAGLAQGTYLGWSARQDVDGTRLLAVRIDGESAVAFVPWCGVELLDGDEQL
jgi:hypothetical protein